MSNKLQPILVLIGLVIAIVAVFLLVFAIRGEERSEGKIVIGSKEFTEQLILAELLAQLIEAKAGLEVERKTGLGGTLICFGALKKGGIDLYPEYTGTGLKAILKHEENITDPDKVYELVKKEFATQFNLEWLKSFGFNNTYALAMRKEHADSLGISKVSDLVKHPELSCGFTAEFNERDDGYPGLAKHYGFKFEAEPKDLDPGLMYKAVKEKQVDVISAFATDGRIRAYELKVLEDDRQFFPPYYAAPLITQAALNKYPELKEVLNSLASRIDDATMSEMNFEVDKGGKSPAQVAKEFLQEEGLLSEKEAGHE